MTSILIVDDHDGVRRAIRSLLESANPEALIGEATTVAGAIDRMIERTWTVAVVDLSLPDGSGLDLIRDFTTVCPGTTVIVVSGMAGAHYGPAAVRAGARAFVAKQDIGDSLVTTVREAIEGSQG